MKDDSVSRAAVLNLIEQSCCDLEYDCDNVALRKEVEALPSAQPEIIHCKDCKYNPNPPEFGNAACVLFYGMTDQMGFCHHGERRERE